MMTIPAQRLILAAALACGMVAAGVAAALVFRPALPAIARPDPAAFPAPLVRQGAILAGIGDCAVCHTAEGGRPYTGGRPLATPFGTLYASNITPDTATGIGAWSFAAFRRAMRDGVDREGRHLYPALPYEHYTHVSDDDLAALYAFLMTRPAVTAPPHPNHLIPPLGFRPLLAGWKLLFLHPGPFVPDPDRSAEWNRGAYLVDGLAHCGGCHTPRNLAGGEEGGRPFAGGVAEGWNAPPLDRHNPGAVPWTVDDLYAYLRSGSAPRHGPAGGPMGPVAHHLADAPEADVRAIATYIVSLMAPAPGHPPDQTATAPADHAETAAQAHPRGAALFTGACAGCHGPGARMLEEAGRAPLSFVTAIQADDPLNTVNAILQGLQAPVGETRPLMPAFADSLTDPQVAEIAAYVRARYTDHPAWNGLERTVRAARAAATESTRP